MNTASKVISEPKDSGRSALQYLVDLQESDDKVSGDDHEGQAEHSEANERERMLVAEQGTTHAQTRQQTSQTKCGMKRWKAEEDDDGQDGEKQRRSTVRHCRCE